MSEQDNWICAHCNEKAERGDVHYCVAMGAEERIAAALERIAGAIERAAIYTWAKKEG